MNSGWRGTRVSCKGKMDLSDFRGSGVFIGFARGRPYSLFAGGADIDGSCHRRQFALLQVPFLQEEPLEITAPIAAAGLRIEGSSSAAAGL